MRIIGKILLFLLKAVLLIVLIPIFILNLLITYVGSILSAILGIVGGLVVIVGFLSLIFGQLTWSEAGIFLIAAFVFGILPFLLVTFGSGLLSAIQQGILTFVFGSKVPKAETETAELDYIPDQNAIPQNNIMIDKAVVLPENSSVPYDQLVELKRLRDMDIITEEEFEAKKQQLLQLS